MPDGWIRRWKILNWNTLPKAVLLHGINFIVTFLTIVTAQEDFGRCPPFIKGNPLIQPVRQH